MSDEEFASKISKFGRGEPTVSHATKCLNKRRSYFALEVVLSADGKTIQGLNGSILPEVDGPKYFDRFVGQVASRRNVQEIIRTYFILFTETIRTYEEDEFDKLDRLLKQIERYANSTEIQRLQGYRNELQTLLKRYPNLSNGYPTN